MALDHSQRYTVVPSNLEKLLNRVPALGRPDKVNSGWLASIGMGGGNNQSMLRVLKGLGAVGKDGAPTELWGAIRAKDKLKLGAAVRRMYSDLFSIYPDAHQKDAEALTAFFRANTDLGDRAQRLSVQTFQILCKFGDFSSEAASETLDEDRNDEAPEPEKQPDQKRRTPPPPTASAPVALTVNIQLQLPPSAEGDVYDKLFSAMATHLRGLVLPE
jgi:hypothetical protein